MAFPWSLQEIFNFVFTGTALKVDLSGTPPGALTAEPFSGTADGAVVDCTKRPLSAFSLQVVAGAGVTAWEVALRVSNDGVNFSTLITHKSTDTADKDLVASGQLKCPALYYRHKCISVTGGTVTVSSSGVP